MFPSDKDWEVCLHTLRLLQSLLAVEKEEDGEEVLEGRQGLAASLLDPELRARISQLAHRGQSSLRLAAHQTLEDLQQVLVPYLVVSDQSGNIQLVALKADLSVLTDELLMLLITDCFQVSVCKEHK